MRLQPIIFIILLAVCGCQNGSLTNPDSTTSYPVNVHMQGGFADDSVLISIDEQIILNGVFSTDLIILICGSAKIDLHSGRHFIIARLPQNAVTTQTAFINTKHEVWIGVNYNSAASEFNFIVQNSPFGYK